MGECRYSSMCFNLCTKGKWPFTVTSVTLLRGESSWHQMDMRLAKTQSWYECDGKGETLPFLEIKLLLSGLKLFTTE
jgi:hypothetical protein